MRVLILGLYRYQGNQERCALLWTSPHSSHIDTSRLTVLIAFYPIYTRTTPFDNTLHPYYPIRRQTTPFAGTLYLLLPYPRKNLTLWQYPSSPLPYPLPHLYKNHTLCWYPSSLLQHHLTPPHHTLCQYPSSLPTYTSICVCVIDGVLYDRIEVISLGKISSHWVPNVI